MSNVSANLLVGQRDPLIQRASRNFRRVDFERARCMISPLHLEVVAEHIGDFSTRCIRSGEPIQGTVLALHSLGLDAHAFDAMRLSLGPQWHTTSFDQRGHGYAALHSSPALECYVDDALVMLDRCPKGPIHLVGHSLGGAIAANVAAASARASPGRIASLTVIASPPAGLPSFAGRGARSSARGMGALVPETLTRWFGDDTSTDAHLIRKYANDALSVMTPHGLGAAWLAFATFKGYECIASRLPQTLCIAMRDDLTTSPRVMQPIVDAIKAARRPEAARLVCLDKGGHLAPVAAPAEMTDLLVDHWQKASADA
jgi:3-oxoadipate enol-lactonase